MTTMYDWPEHASHENGKYSCVCTTCGVEFVGHKRTVECKKCYIERIEGELACACEMLNNSAAMVCVTCGSTEQPCCDNEKIRPVAKLHAHLLLRDARKDVKTLENFILRLQSAGSDQSMRELFCDLSKELQSAHKRAHYAEELVDEH